MTWISPVGTSPSPWSGAGLRTATAQVETPRIITPSRTACPPTGASFTASRSGLGDAEALICLRRLARRGAGEEARVVALVELADGVVGIDAHAQRARAGGTGEAERRGVTVVELADRLGVEHRTVDAQDDIDSVGVALPLVADGHAVGARVGGRARRHVDPVDRQIRQQAAADRRITCLAVEQGARGRARAEQDAHLVG